MRGATTTQILLVALLFLCTIPSQNYAETESNPESLKVEILDSTPHDHTSFTQGLELTEGRFLESSGLYGHSRISEIDIDSGEIVRQIWFEETIFAEGITVRDESIIMLTWREGIAIEISLVDFNIINNYSYEGEGWGICFNGQHLVMTNGSSDLIFRDPYTFEVNHTLRVTMGGEEVRNLNELECVGDTIYANVWLEDFIIGIDSSSGKVIFSVSASEISEIQGNSHNEVLNGIAHDESSGAFWITGKNWTELYLVDFLPKESDRRPDTSQLSSKILPVALFVGVTLMLYRITQSNKDPETPNFKDHRQ